ncbi:MAG: asparagine synthase-related protein [Candidatus Jettenia sp. CY-1]|nr:MAG: asparagine synthase-related protein [Candidatus Jettenia sp. CY-1]
MSGIHGFAAHNGVSDPTDILNRMLKAIPSPESSVKYHWATQEGHAGLGTIYPSRTGGSRYFAEDASNGLWCVFDGIIYRDNNDLDREDLIEHDGATLLLEHYLRSGIDCLRKINGSFNVAWWDGKNRRMVLANDKFGQRPLFWGSRNGTLVFASMLARIMATGMLPREIDVEGFADLLSYEYILGEKTLFKDIHILPPASYLTYKDTTVHVEQYWHLDHIQPHGRYDKRRLDELENILKIAVRRSTRSDLNCAIAMTGGLDSRCILAAAANQKLSFFTHTSGQPNSTDVVLAKQLADQTGVRHSFELTDPHALSEWLTPMVLHQGGIMATLHSHTCQILYSHPSFDAVVHGIGGEFIRSFWATPKDLTISNFTTVQKLLKQRMLGKKRPRYLEQLWKQEFRILGLRAPEEHINTILSGYTSQDPSFASVMDYLYLHERCRKFLNKGILTVRPSVDVYFPYLDHQWIEAVAAIPISERITNRIQIDLIRRLCPEILDFPYAKNLIPLSAPPWKVKTIKYYRGIKQRGYQRLGLVYRGPAEVPTSYYSRWIREEMRNTITDIVYNPKAAFRTYLNWETVETLLNQHFSGKENWETLVAALTVFEISHKLWVAP